MSIEHEFPAPVAEIIDRRNEEEGNRRGFLRWAQGQFAGGALLGGLAAAEAIALATGAELPMSPLAQAAAGGAAVAGSIGLVTRGLVNRERAADASRNASRLVQVLAEHELAGPSLNPDSDVYFKERRAMEKRAEIAAARRPG